MKQNHDMRGVLLQARNQDRTQMYTSKRKLTEDSFASPREEGNLVRVKGLLSDRLMKHHGSVLDFAIPGEIMRARVIYAAAPLYGGARSPRWHD